MGFKSELEFEEALTKILIDNGWEEKVLKNCTEKDLIKNWANILFENNRGIDRLNDYPLTDSEMDQIIEQIEKLRTPLRLNGFINGKSVSITRDNPDDVEHFGKEVSLKIYDRREIAAGQSRYQIVRQPRFKTPAVLNDRRGDMMLLINGMPVIHIELKRDAHAVHKACNQIEKYSHEGVFTGLFSLIQVFVAMEPDETLYFANPGSDGMFNPDYYFHWADFNNTPINNWRDIAATLLSIPMAHQLIGFYTVADNADGVLKVMRSYQYFAASAISDKVAKTRWNEGNQLGGYIWHTTGSGKTMTSFKSAQLIAGSKDADKVIFLIDRIELGIQSLNEYRSFADETESVQATEDTGVLITKLKSSDPANTLIVTSIQKMSNIKDDAHGLNSNDIEVMNRKRIVFIIDEAHRSTFGDMLLTIKDTFPNAIFFGFTGTPIQDENERNGNTTSTVFGNELHRYSIADGIRDKNVLGFDPYMVMTFKDRDVRKAVALDKAKADTETEAMSDPEKCKIYEKYMNKKNFDMAGHIGKDGRYVKGIEDFLSNKQYQTPEHTRTVVQDIIDNWETLSKNSKFHAIFATSSIPEAINYYRLFREMAPKLKVTALFDPNIDNNGNGIYKEDGLVEIITDYKEQYGKTFSIATFAKMKKDISARLAHKKPYERIANEPQEQIDLLIVVDQMLTGFDSKWINTLYLDKILQYENIIQAFSRTNRLFGPDKPFGTIRYYRRPHTMEKNINAAVKTYSGDKPLGLFVQRLPKNLQAMNSLFESIKILFTNKGTTDYTKLPPDLVSRKMFVRLFNDFNSYLEAAKIQGFKWSITSYKGTKKGENIKMLCDYVTYSYLLQRYKELSKEGDGGSDDTAPYDLVGYITEIDTGAIDAEYMNNNFVRYMKALSSNTVSDEETEAALRELHKSFASLSKEEQKYADIFLHDVQRGDAILSEGKTFRDYITEYQSQAKDDQVHRIADALGLDEEKLRNIMNARPTEANMDEFGRYQALKATVDRDQAKAYFDQLEGQNVPMRKINVKVDNLLRAFILKGGMNIIRPDGAKSSNNEKHDVQMLHMHGWFFYLSGEENKLRSDVTGKWMYFFKDQEKAQELCQKAIEEKVCYECKCSDLELQQKQKGVICFYLNGDDEEAHKKVIQFMLDNGLVPRTRSSRYHNLSFKFDSQTIANEYGSDFEGKIHLDEFIDLNTGEWIK